MSKGVNVVDSVQLATAEFDKIFGNDASMYIPATELEISQYLKNQQENIYLFVVPREKPLISERYLPKPLLEESKYHLVAQPGEFYVFQVVVWAPESGLFDVRASVCEAVSFTKPGNVRGGEVKIFWIGIDIPNMAGKMLSKEITIYTKNMGNKTIKVDILVEGDFLSDRGESCDEKMARLRWLNSDIGMEDTVFPPYIPLQRNGNTLLWLGHTMTLGKNGLPAKITSDLGSKSSQLLNTPIKIESDKGEFQGEIEFVRETQTRIEWKSKGRIGEYIAELHAALEFDGYLEFSLRTKGVGNYRLCVECTNTDYMIGLGKHGGKAPKRMDWFWDQHAWQDGCWLGNIEGGIRLRLRDSKYKQPLLNCYYHFSEINLPEAWHNNGRGGISLQDHKLIAFSGEISENKTHEFGFDLQITPFHVVDVEKHFKTRTWHPFIHDFEIDGSDPLEETDFGKLKAEGVNRINVHHGIAQNPFINYPISNISINKLKELVERAHEQGIEVVIYYTMRELSVHPAEFWAFRAMGDDILQAGLGEDARPATNGTGPHSWLCQNLFTPYLPAWGERIKNGPAYNNIDIALETVPESKRLENFYLEGLRYLLEHCPIDGLYIDDTTLSREGFQRLYRIFYKYRKKAPIIDFHAWNPYRFDPQSRDFGRCSVILRDMNKLPYFTQLWLGEAFDYENTSPDYYLTEISGIPFGLMGQMLQGGGNPWRGILYGMTSRYGWKGDPRNLWKFFDKFGVSGMKMELDAPFPVKLPTGIRVTRFTNNEKKCCYVLASWAALPVTIDLVGSCCQTEEISGFQTEGQCVIEPGQGLIIIFRKGEGRKLG